MSTIDDFEKSAAQLEDGKSPGSPTASSPDSPTLTNTSTRSSWFRRGSFSDIWTRIRSGSKATNPEEATGNVKSANGLGIGEAEVDPADYPSNQPLKVRSLQKFDTGYPHLAAFADSDESYMVYRRFGYLQARILLEKQDDLRRLEQELDELDYADVSDSYNLEMRDRQGQEKRNLLIKIENAYCNYAQLIGAAQQLMSAQRPTGREHQAILHFMDRQPVHPKEAEYVYWREDLLSLRPGRELAWLDRAIENTLKWVHVKMGFNIVERIFSSQCSRDKSNDEKHIYYDRDRISRAASTLLTTMLLFLLVVPIYLLYHIVVSMDGKELSAQKAGVCIGILLVFTLIFSAAMSLFTRAKRHEIFAAAAAYCAVLVVFMGNVGSG